MKEIKKLTPEAVDPYLESLFEDVTGQMAEATSCMQYFMKWGRHYLPSLMFAHQLQQCNNFKDPGVQSYGGQLFTELRDAGDDMFCQLPPPKPSLEESNNQIHQTTCSDGHAPEEPIRMANY